MKCADTEQPARAGEVVKFPGRYYPAVFEGKPHPKAGQPLEIWIQTIYEEADRDILIAARESAKAAGANPVAGDPIFDRDVALLTVLATVMDNDARDERFFADVAEIRKKFMPEVIGYLYAQWEAIQNAYDPLRRQLNDDEIFVRIEEEAQSKDARFFREFGPALQWSLFHFTAVLLVNSPDWKLRRSSATGGGLLASSDASPKTEVGSSSSPSTSDTSTPSSS